jgi:hypothetical protein
MKDRKVDWEWQSSIRSIASEIETLEVGICYQKAGDMMQESLVAMKANKHRGKQPNLRLFRQNGESQVASR